MSELALFPLNIVAFPGEAVNLHIFEPRYKMLINECLAEDLTFGIPAYVLNKIELGTEVEIIEITKTYDDGRMDIKTKALKAFNVNEFWNPWGDKEYAGGSVDYLPISVEETDLNLLYEFKEMVAKLFGWLGETDVPDISTITSVYDIGHKIGLKPEEEYKLLHLIDENERLNYAVKHLKHLLPALERAQNAQERIKQNGHFKHLDPLKF
ncbi:LON peptidase substrate-binding domain-containing protein [Ekhidna sp. To15]|uniref:LON peptidase substrate-binding domain-containing protein n=1 Tax=Ekhidna sp. To15 TaxID=3395267 RepID=UPI003F527B4C